MKRRTRHGKAILAASLWLAALTIPASAGHSNCGFTVAMEQMLRMRFGETVVAEIVEENPDKPGVMVQFRLWVNEETGSWSFTGSADDGYSCIFQSGTAAERRGRTLEDFLYPSSYGA